MDLVANTIPSDKRHISVDPFKLTMYDDLTEVKKSTSDIGRRLSNRLTISEAHSFLVDDFFDFWNAPIDFNDEAVSKNNSPFIVMLDTPMAKIHFLFTMLNINMLLVLKRGLIKGIITKLEFIQKR